MLRMFLAAISSFCEAKFYRTVVETVNERVGRYLLFSLFFGAGMFGASVGESTLLFPLVALPSRCPRASRRYP